MKVRRTYQNLLELLRPFNKIASNGEISIAIYIPLGSCSVMLTFHVLFAMGARPALS